MSLPPGLSPVPAAAGKEASPSRTPAILPPSAPVLVLGTRRALWLDAEGEVEELSFAQAARRVSAEPAILAHARAAARRLNLREIVAYDVLELFAFACPATFCLPTPRGVMEAVGLGRPASAETAAMGLLDAIPLLLDRIRVQASPRLGDLARSMARGGWAWGEAVLAALGTPADPTPAGRVVRPVGLDIWTRLPEWEEAGPVDPPGSRPVDPGEARQRLSEILGTGNESEPGAGGIEARPQQADFASAASAAFAPRPAPDTPVLVLAEAGTGIGKTLGYLAPASLWAERNGAPVWISTYTRNLQAQIDGELDRVYESPAEKREKVVLRKGRENYLCLLNYDEAVGTVAANPRNAVPLGLMARWAMATKDGALIGGDFPGWLADLIGRPQSLGLGDRRGECIYSACLHYKRCFIEHSIRRARRADIVVANHAYVMIQAALGGADEGMLPQRYVFDEGHHLFEAADGAFSAELSGQSGAELRRWILGAEGASSRARGLRRRIEDLVAGDDKAAADLVEAMAAAGKLPGEGWPQRLAEGTPRHAVERFLMLARGQVLARAPRPESQYDLETERQPPAEGLVEAAGQAEAALAELEAPIARLVKYLAQRLDLEAEDLDSADRNRIEAMVRSLERRALMTLRAWGGMLRDLGGETPESHVDWLSVSRQDGREVDVGLHRHWIDPTLPLAEAVLRPAHGALVTSATLTDIGARDGGGEPDITGLVDVDWRAAEARTGALHLPRPAIRARMPSPFDYKAATRAFIVTDVRKDDLDQVAAAYRELFLAAGGGGLGLFTAISRLRAVYDRTVGPLDAAGLPLMAQHIDPVDIGTLIDIFRAEEDSCLLGTDAVRDGVDVPGRSLRLIVFDRVPWPRPDILHKARRLAFGGRAYDDRLARFKLRQAFGRLIRRAGDRGVFTLLDPMMPSRLLGAFPEGVEVRRVGLKEAIAETRAFLAEASLVETGPAETGSLPPPSAHPGLDER